MDEKTCPRHCRHSREIDGVPRTQPDCTGEHEECEIDEEEALVVAGSLRVVRPQHILEQHVDAVGGRTESEYRPRRMASTREGADDHGGGHDECECDRV